MGGDRFKSYCSEVSEKEYSKSDERAGDTGGAEDEDVVYALGGRPCGRRMPVFKSTCRLCSFFLPDYYKGRSTRRDHSKRWFITRDLTVAFRLLNQNPPKERRDAWCRMQSFAVVFGVVGVAKRGNEFSDCSSSTMYFPCDSTTQPKAAQSREQSPQTKILLVVSRRLGADLKRRNDSVVCVW